MGLYNSLDGEVFGELEAEDARRRNQGLLSDGHST